MKSVIVVGGGWAGLSCAAFLAPHCAVTLIEASPQLGGRARSVSMKSIKVDNGQHLFLGAYTHLISLLHLLGLDSNDLFHKEPLHWQVRSKHNKLIIKHSLLSFLCAKLSLKDKGLLLQAFIYFKKAPANHDTPLLETLLQLKQSQTLIDMVWQPLCLAALSTPIEHASTHVFSAILKQTFSQRNPEYWFAKQDLNKVLPLPVCSFLNHRAIIKTHERAESILVNNGIIQGIKTTKATYTAQDVVIATTATSAAQLLDDVAPSLAQPIKGLSHESITTVYLQYPKHTKLPHTMTGLIGTQAQWVFDRRVLNQEGLLSVVITGQGEHTLKPHTLLVQEISQELKSFWPQCEGLLHSKVIHEKRAAFRCDVFSQSLRPTVDTHIEGLYLAGDYCQTPYPASIEGAVMTGMQAAKAVLKKVVV